MSAFGIKMRVVDGSVLKLIKLWLEAPVVEPPEKPGGKRTVKRNDKGTPQGGVISPLWRTWNKALLMP